MPVPPLGRPGDSSVSGSQGVQWGTCPGSQFGAIALTPYQFAYGMAPTTILGGGQQGVNWKEIDGLDISGMRSSDSAKPRDQGEFIGYDFLAGRDVTLKFDCSYTASATLSQNLLTVSTLFLPQNNIETPLYLNLIGLQGSQGIGTTSMSGGQTVLTGSQMWGNQNGGQGQLAIMARPRNRSWKIDVAFSLGSLAQDLQVMVHATDPRFYSTPTQLALSNNNTGELDLWNDGNYDCKPRIVLYGPLSLANGSQAPSINNLANNQPGLSWPNFVLPSGWQINLDCYYETATVQSNTGAQTTVAVGQQGTILSSIISGGLMVLSTEGFDGNHGINGGMPYLALPLALGGSAAGWITVPTTGSASQAVFSYTGTTGTSFTGLALQSGNSMSDVTASPWTVIQSPFGPKPFTAGLGAGSQWFTMPPQYNQIFYQTVTTSSGTYPFSVEWANAWIL